MRIGIDFDNTIVKYDNLFKEVALKEGFIKENWNGNGKTGLRNHLRSQPNGEKTWMKVQGLVYGKYMHGAGMMPGVASFLFSCKERNHRVCIISHKTEYGHYDTEKISLRREALKWMENKHFFDPEHFNIHKEDIYFAGTREEKVRKIAQLDCHFFIDDLPEVFEEANFPSDTKKILFGDSSGEKLSRDTAVLDSWKGISDIIFGQTTDDDIISGSRWVTDQLIENLQRIPGRSNSKVYKLTTTGGNSYAVKYYPDQTSDKRPRLKTEFNTLKLLHQHHITNVPKAVEKDEKLNLGFYEWMKGEPVTAPTPDDLNKAIDFIKKLQLLSREIGENDIQLASEACLSAYDLSHQIEERLRRLQKVSLDSQNTSIFLNDAFIPLLQQVRDESICLWPEESRIRDLPRDKQTLSPSDFGFHNCLKASDGSMTFLDFDYFGWDDPVKLMADFIWHPAMNLRSALREKWKTAMLRLFACDTYFEERLNAAMPLYGLRWALIVLNEFLPELAQKRRDAHGLKEYDLERRQRIQLKKAKQYCDQVKNTVSQYTFG